MASPSVVRIVCPIKSSLIVMLLLTNCLSRKSQAQGCFGGLSASMAGGAKSAMRKFNGNDNAVTRHTKNMIFTTLQRTRNIKSDDKVGLAMIEEEFDEATKNVPTKPDPSPNIVHRYELIDIDTVVDNIFSFASDVKHPPKQEDLIAKVHQSDGEKSLIVRLKRRVNKSIGTFEEYADVVVRYQKWYMKYERVKQHKGYEHMSNCMQVVWNEYSKATQELREARSTGLSGAPPEMQAEYEKSVNHDRDIVLEALTITVDRLERQLNESDPHILALLGGPIPDPRKRNVDDRPVRKFVKKLRTKVIAEAKSLIISEARHLAKFALLALVSKYVTKTSGLQYEGYLLYVRNLLHILGKGSVKLAVDSLRDEAGRTAFTLLNVFDPMPNLTSLLKGIVG